MIKKTFYSATSILLLASTLAYASCDSEKTVEKESNQPNTVKETKGEGKKMASPRKQAEGKIGETKITIDYGSPSVKGRKIWGGLEAYGKVWRAGANEATNMEFSNDVMVNGEKLAAGKYAFFLIPNEEGEWEVIFNNEWKQWGAYKYKKEEDALRLKVKPEWVEKNQETLEYMINGEYVQFAWEKVRINLAVK